MKLRCLRLLLPLTIFMLSAYLLPAQPSAQLDHEKRRWFIALPLRFTHLQNHHTMLSGVKIGREVNASFSAAISVYHSFYLASFRSEANLAGFDKQPRLFINGAGIEADYLIHRSKKTTTTLQLFAGWGLMNYDLKAHRFESKQINYLALEPALQTFFQLNTSTTLGLGIGYRPVFTNQTIAYTSDASNGTLPIATTWPNGVNLLLTLKGYL